MEIFLIDPELYESKDDFIRACRDNLAYELYAYMNTEGIILVKYK
jgi:hypothetical protein